MAQVERIEPSSSASLSGDGGYAVDTLLVTGVPTEQVLLPSSEALGVPALYSPHPLYTALECWSKSRAAIIDSTTTLIQCTYRPQSFNLGWNYSSDYTTTETTRLELFWNRVTIGGVTVWQKLTSNRGSIQNYIEIPTFRRIVRRNMGGDVESVIASIEKNLGKFYLFGPTGQPKTPYLLTSCPVTRTQAGQVVAEFTFMTRAGYDGLPANTFPGQQLAIPGFGFLDVVSDYYDPSDNEPEITVRPYTDIYKPGNPLW